jgi:hypothetical protein
MGVGAWLGVVDVARQTEKLTQFMKNSDNSLVAKQLQQHSAFGTLVKGLRWSTECEQCRRVTDSAHNNAPAPSIVSARLAGRGS